MLITRHPRKLMLAAIAAVAAITPATASAANQRYASPGGAGSACTAAAPCDVLTAVGFAAKDDEVIVNPGVYQLGATLQNKVSLDIHGVDGQPRPRIYFTGAAWGGYFNYGANVRHLEFIMLSPGVALWTGSGMVDDVVASASGTNTETARIEGGEVRNSVFIAYGQAGTAVRTQATGGALTATYRNVTAVSEGLFGNAIQAHAAGAAGDLTLNLVNVIAKSDSASLSSATDNSGAHAKIVVSHSEYQSSAESGTNASVQEVGGNQAALPKFVDPSVANYHEAAGSPTIDKGIDDPLNGQFDFDGGSRILGTTDIGADEYGSVPAPPGGGGGGGGGSSDPASGSAPDQPTGDSSGSGLPTAQTTTTEASKTVVPFAGVRLVSRKLTLSGKFVAIRLRCPAAAKGGCAGRTKLIARKRRAHSSRNVVLGQARFSIAAGAHAKVLVRVSRANRRLVRRSPHLLGVAITDSRNTAGQAARSVDHVSLRHRRA